MKAWEDYLEETKGDVPDVSLTEQPATESLKNDKSDNTAPSTEAQSAGDAG